MERATREPAPWSFHPLSALLLASTDVVAGGGDVAAAATGGLGYLLVLLVASGGAVAIAAIELVSERRIGRALALMALAWVLIAIPTPVAGLVGAGASLGARLLRRGGRS